MAKMRKPISLPAGGASQANIDKALAEQADYLRNVVQKSVAGLDLESNHSATITANGTTVINPAEGKDGMEKTTVTVAVPLEDNKASTIDVSQYESAVEITPTDGKTAMKKTTVTLSNIPVIESNKAATIDVSQYSEAVEVTPSSNKDAMEKATVTLTNIPDLENNKSATINVSEYTQPVEITPTAGKDGMKKVTVSLSNMPAGVTMLYAWSTTDIEQNPSYQYLNINSAPANPAVGDILTIEQDSESPYYMNKGFIIQEGDVYTKVSDTEFTLSWEVGGQPGSQTFTRDAAKDIEVWNAPPEVETTKQATIDVSTYDPSNKPVITPTAGKQSMGSVEITLDNIPSGGSGNFTAYCWLCTQSGEYSFFDFSIAPDNANDSLSIIGSIESGLELSPLLMEGDIYTKLSDNSFSISWEEGQTTETYTFTRDSTEDFVAWVDELDANKTQTIDVSQYSAPVEVIPTVGKDGMRKATITLSNIPSGLEGFVKVEDNQGRGEYAIARLPITVGQTIWDYLTGGTATITYISEESHYFDVDGLEGEYILP